MSDPLYAKEDELLRARPLPFILLLLLLLCNYISRGMFHRLDATASDCGLAAFTLPSTYF